jgi:uncharacterized phosphosugar-binding protein
MDPNGTGASAAYVSRVIQLVEALGDSQQGAISRAAALVAESWSEGGRLMVARTQHSLHTELVHRASGPAAILPLDDGGIPHDREVEELPQLRRGDVVLIHSNAGTTVKTVSLALLAASRGVPTIALTQMPFESRPDLTAQHPSGKRLNEVSTITIDLGGDPADGAVEVPGLDVAVGPTSGATGVVAAWMIVVGACAIMASKNELPFILQGLQVPGADTRNRRLLQEWHETGLAYEAGSED